MVRRIDEYVSQIDLEILNFLKEKGVSYELREHAPVYTAPQMAEYLGTSEQRIEVNGREEERRRVCSCRSAGTAQD